MSQPMTLIAKFLDDWWRDQAASTRAHMNRQGKQAPEEEQLELLSSRVWDTFCLAKYLSPVMLLAAASCQLKAEIMLQCMQEIARLEGARKDLMMGIIDSKRQHLVTLCETSHMPIPPMPEAGAQESGEVEPECKIPASTVECLWEGLSSGWRPHGKAQILDDSVKIPVYYTPLNGWMVR